MKTALSVKRALELDTIFDAVKGDLARVNERLKKAGKPLRVL